MYNQKILTHHQLEKARLITNIINIHLDKYLNQFNKNLLQKYDKSLTKYMILYPMLQDIIKQVVVFNGLPSGLRLELFSANEHLKTLRRSTLSIARLLHLEIHPALDA